MTWQLTSTARPHYGTRRNEGAPCVAGLSEVAGDDQARGDAGQSGLRVGAGNPAAALQGRSPGRYAVA